jgi:TolB-like protein/cytochrome c-type biogenesis protein CcmH/NrfG
MSDSKSAVFLSYASQDAEAARRICEALRAAGLEVWFDQSELRGGDAWDQKIRRQIKECALFVPIISAATQARAEGYFRLEWRLADQRTHLMGRNRAFIFPVCVDRTPDAGADVPDSFLTVQWTRLPGGETSVAVAEHVRRLLSREQGVGSKEQGMARVSGPVGSEIMGRETRATAVEGKSVAVLAFANLSNDAENEFFSDGISEELINVLVRVPGLKVTARTSAFHFKRKDTPVAEIARQLGVAYVVEGSVRKAGDRVRITAQLIKAADGFHVWSDTFTRDLKDIFAVQDEIAGLVAENLSLKLGAAAGPAREVNPAAYRLFLEGRTIFNREGTDDHMKAVARYKESLAIDPESALTWAWLSMAYGMAAGSGTHVVDLGNKLARDSARRAVELDPGLAKGHVALAFVLLLYDWEWPKAAAALERAVMLAPGDVEALSLQSHLWGFSGKTERAIMLARKAAELDPFNYFAGYVLIRSLSYAGRFEEMEKAAEHVIALNPTGVRSRSFLSTARLLQGRADAAAQAAEEVPAGWARHTVLACARFAQGRQAESDRELAALKAGYSVHAAYQVAQVHGYRGDIEEGFEWLEKSYVQRDSGMALIKSDPLLQRLHGDARWEPFLRKMKLADEQLTWLA